ncbi:hypothetical protein CRUP_019874 [Coryphaenoides rupestris]|nr:hypothetical protein CRUP_019874 [Coryphaenoides rupestris]
MASLGLTSLDEELMASFKNLHDLDISSNKLTEVPGALRSLKWLIILNLSNNPFDVLKMNILLKLFGLQELDLTLALVLGVAIIAGAIICMRKRRQTKAGIELELGPTEPDHMELEGSREKGAGLWDQRCDLIPRTACSPSVLGYGPLAPAGPARPRSAPLGPARQECLGCCRRKTLTPRITGTRNPANPRQAVWRLEAGGWRLAGQVVPQGARAQTPSPFEKLVSAERGWGGGGAGGRIPPDQRVACQVPVPVVKVTLDQVPVLLALHTELPLQLLGICSGGEA